VTAAGTPLEAGVATDAALDDELEAEAEAEDELEAELEAELEHAATSMVAAVSATAAAVILGSRAARAELRIIPSLLWGGQVLGGVTSTPGINMRMNSYSL
jgi:hypothetical protein